MNDEQMQPLLEVWLRDREVPRPQVQMGVGRVMGNVPQTRQHGRWLPFPSFKPKAQTPTAIPDTEYQPTSIPAMNGHSPTVSGRTQSMFSPVKAITAGALVFALGGVLLIAQPFDQQGSSVPGAATDVEREAPVEFSGRIAFGQCSGGEATELTGNVRQTIGDSCEPATAVGMSDPRLDGEVTIVVNHDFYRPALDGSTPGTHLWRGYFDIVTEEGTWRGEPSLLFDFADGGSTATYVFVGEGTYEGLTAIAEGVNSGAGWDLRGFIIDGNIPAAPRNAFTE